MKRSLFDVLTLVLGFLETTFSGGVVIMALSKVQEIGWGEFFSFAAFNFNLHDDFFKFNTLKMN